MGCPESWRRRCQRSRPNRRKRSARRPRLRCCLLKGCEQRFHTLQLRQRYCSVRCRMEARKWSRWKAQQRYRQTATGQVKRHGQSRRYRERVKSRNPPKLETVSEAARVITKEHFFRAYLRPARVLRVLRAPAAKSVAAFLLRIVPASAGAGDGAGAAMEAGAHLIQTY
jgi:hypothetical protein